MKHFSILLSALTLALTAAANPAEKADYRLEVQDFTELRVTDGLNVTYHASSDSAGWVTFSCTPDVARRLLFTNDKSSLHIQLDNPENAALDLPEVHVYSSSLGKVENASDSTLTVASSVPVDKFSGTVIGNGTLRIVHLESPQVSLSIKTGRGHVIVMGGQAGNLKLHNVGTGPIEAGSLKALKAKVMLFGTGSIDCHVTEKLSVYGAGSGRVYYAGDPAEVVNRSLGVKSFAINPKNE